MTQQTVAAGGVNVMNMQYNFDATGHNNGRVVSTTDVVAGETVSYTYDGLNRLTQAAAGTWTQNYGYDGFGNLTSKSGGGSDPGVQRDLHGEPAERAVVRRERECDGRRAGVRRGESDDLDGRVGGVHVRSCGEAGEEAYGDAGGVLLLRDRGTEAGDGVVREQRDVRVCGGASTTCISAGSW